MIEVSKIQCLDEHVAIKMEEELNLVEIDNVRLKSAVVISANDITLSVVSAIRVGHMAHTVEATLQDKIKYNEVV